MNCPPHQIWFGWSNQEELDGQDMCLILGAGEVHKGSSGETWVKEIIWKTRCRWEGNIKMDLQEVEWEGMDCIDLAQDVDRWRAVISEVMKLRVP